VYIVSPPFSRRRRNAPFFSTAWGGSIFWQAGRDFRMMKFMHTHKLSHSRRTFLKTFAAAGTGMAGMSAFGSIHSHPERRAFHLSISIEALENDPEWLNIARNAGISAAWIAGFFYGYWPHPIEALTKWRRRAEAMGMGAHAINVPLGHPGDSLGAKSGHFPLTPPTHWRMGVRPDGTPYAGTSLHAPATEENAAAMRALAAAGVRRVFVDDDFRLAQAPGVIGGCYCGEHKRAFLKSRGYGENKWDELLGDVARRNLSKTLREWIDFTCDELTTCFRAQQAAAPVIELGNMIMFMGSESAGIRLDDYRKVPFRVGELMFDDASFAPIKGKTNELFSALFHRRFAGPDRAFSETTAFPSDKLSAQNMAAKLIVSTIADVRNTMFMSGITPFPKAHWDTLAPAMKRQAELHARVAGHTPRGPFKHFWGEHGRRVGDANPYSLFLATGMPFEVTAKPEGGYVFLGNDDARGLASIPAGKNTIRIARPGAGASGVRETAEELPALFELKHEAVSRFRNLPHVENDIPAVFAWYPSARCAIAWNLTETRAEAVVRVNDARRTIPLEPLECVLVEDMPGGTG